MSTPFKMKGSPAKLGTIQGTSGHASALKKAAAFKDETERELTRRGQKRGQTGYQYEQGFKSEQGSKAYGGVLDVITGDMTKKELREYVLANNKGKSSSDASRVSMSAAIKNWRAKQRKGDVVDETTDVSSSDTEVTEIPPVDTTVDTDTETETPKEGGWRVKSGGLQAGTGYKFFSKQSTADLQNRLQRLSKGFKPEVQNDIDLINRILAERK
tara:strand:+ start:956 stop:1597 length:642 start_codon:yes stop_codon:yes gene_type:complete